MWYILAAKPGAKIIYGLKDGESRESLTKAIEEDRILDSLHEVSVGAGDSFFTFLRARCMLWGQACW